MSLNKPILSAAIATALTAAIASPAQAAIIDLNYSGLFTMMDLGNTPINNTSQPYYSDPTWGFGARTQISGSLSYDTVAESGSATVDPFELFEGGPAVISNFKLKGIGGGLLIGNMNFNWNNSDITTQIVLDASGLFTAFNNGLINVDGNTCTNNALNCALPATDTMLGGSYPLGLSPIATLSINTAGQTGFGTTLAQLSLGTDDGIGGSPMDNGPLPDPSINIDMTSVTISTSVVPIPAAVWLFGSGLIGLVGIARRRKPIR